MQKIGKLLSFLIIGTLMMLGGSRNCLAAYGFSNLSGNQFTVTEPAGDYMTISISNFQLQNGLQLAYSTNGGSSWTYLPDTTLPGAQISINSNQVALNFDLVQSNGNGGYNIVSSTPTFSSYFTNPDSSLNYNGVSFQWDISGYPVDVSFSSVAPYKNPSSVPVPAPALLLGSGLLGLVGLGVRRRAMAWL